MVKYCLLNNRGHPIRPTIVIDESAKNDFMELMNWTEEDFKKHTNEYDKTI